MSPLAPLAPHGLCPPAAVEVSEVRPSPPFAVWEFKMENFGGFCLLGQFINFLLISTQLSPLDFFLGSTS